MNKKKIPLQIVPSHPSPHNPSCVRLNVSIKANQFIPSRKQLKSNSVKLVEGLSPSRPMIVNPQTVNQVRVKSIKHYLSRFKDADDSNKRTPQSRNESFLEERKKKVRHLQIEQIMLGMI